MSHRGLEEPAQASTTTEQVAPDAQQRRVRVWFGRHVIAQLIAEPAAADRYAAAMDRRFGGLRITNDPMPGATRSDQNRATPRFP
jgi:hypothetical protein